MFEILRVDEVGNQHHVSVVPTQEVAKALIQSLQEFWPGEYLIRDRATGESISIKTGSDAHLS